MANPWEGHTRTPDVQSNGASQEDEDEDAEFIYPGMAGDYSTQFEKLFDGEEDSESGDAGQISDNDDDDFLYDGIDANTSVTYKDQLREVLGQEDGDEREGEQEVDGSLAHQNAADDEPLVGVHLSMTFCSLIIVTDSQTHMWHSFRDLQMFPRPGFCHQILAYLRQIRSSTL
jgi:hypothetical protein